MRIVDKDEFRAEKELFLREIAQGAIYIHPTDTIYGIGCDATNPDAVKRIRLAKQRYSKPFSIIAPSKEWVRGCCVVDKKAEAWLKKLPGPYTFILKIKKGREKCFVSQTNPGMETIGVRIPDHWFASVASELGVPLITTSANIVGKEFMTSLDNLDPDVAKHMNLIFYEGEKKARPSTIVNLAGEKEQITKR
jgi:L-threonylcarbamoyladenylate synthase